MNTLSTYLSMADRQFGSFQVTSGQVIITDPCYKFDEKKVVPAQNGEWISFVFTHRIYNHITDLVAFINDKNVGDAATEWKSLNFSCPVDSGQAGIFDASFYAQHQGGKYGQLDTLYGAVCHLTCDSIQEGGIVEMKGQKFGAVSVSGYGDGDYNIEGWFYQGKLVGMRIYFDEVEEDEE